MRIPKILWILALVIIIWSVLNPPQSQEKEEKVAKSVVIISKKPYIVVLAKNYENPEFYTEEGSCKIIEQNEDRYTLSCKGKFLFVREGNEVITRRIA